MFSSLVVSCFALMLNCVAGWLERIVALLKAQSGRIVDARILLAGKFFLHLYSTSPRTSSIPRMDFSIKARTPRDLHGVSHVEIIQAELRNESTTASHLPRLSTT
jgi:hypothetical protein